MKTNGRPGNSLPRAVIAALLVVSACRNPSSPLDELPTADIRLEVTPATLTLVEGESGKVEAEEKTMADGKVTARSACVGCDWVTENANVAYVTGSTKGSGVTVIAVAEGQTKVAARWLSAGSVTKEASATIVVTKKQSAPPSLITIAPSSGFIDPGQTMNFVCKTFDNVAQEMANVQLDWTSSAPGVASVDAAGRVLGVADGTATIMCKARGSSVSASAVVTVRTSARQLVLDPADATVLVGNQYRLSLTVRNPITGLGVTTGDVTIAVTPAIARVDRAPINPIRDFDVVGLTEGTATIIMTYQGPGGGTATATVRVVTAASNAVLTTPQGRAIVKGQTTTVGGGVSTLAGQSVSGATVTWRSENPDVATVAGNVVTGVKAGVATIVGEAANAIPGRNFIQVIDQAATCSASQANMSFRTSVFNDPAAKAGQYNVPASLNLSIQVSGTNFTITGPMGTATGSFTTGTCNFFASGTGPIGSLASVPYRIQGFYGSPGEVIWFLFVEPAGTFMTMYRLDRQ